MEKLYKLRKNINFYYDYGKEEIFISNYKTIIKFKIEKHIYENFKEFYNELLTNGFTETQYNKYDANKKKYISLLNKCNAIYVYSTVFRNYPLSNIVIRNATDPLSVVNKILNAEFIIVYSDEFYINYADDLCNVLTRANINARVIPNGYISKIDFSQNDLYMIYIGDLLECKEDYFNGFVCIDESFISYFSLDKKSISDLQEILLYYNESLSLKHIGLHYNFCLQLLYNVFPYFITQAFIDILGTNTIYIDENKYPQYTKYEKTDILLELNEGTGFEKLDINKIPDLDKQLSNSDSLFRNLELADMADFIFNLDVVLRDGKCFNIGSRTYLNTYETALLIGIEFSTSKYMLSNINNSNLDQKINGIYIEFESENIEHRNVLIKYYRINEHIIFKTLKNENIKISVICDAADNIWAIEVLDINEYLRDVEERCIIRYKYRKTYGFKPLGKYCDVLNLRGLQFYTLGVLGLMAFKDVNINEK